MHSVSARIWTRVTVSISNGDNHYTTDTLFFCFLFRDVLHLLSISFYNTWIWYNFSLPLFVILPNWHNALLIQLTVIEIYSPQPRRRNLVQAQIAHKSWGCKIHQLHLCRRVRPHIPNQQLSWWWDSSNARPLGNVEFPFIAITIRSTLA